MGWEPRGVKGQVYFPAVVFHIHQVLFFAEQSVLEGFCRGGDTWTCWRRNVGGQLQLHRNLPWQVLTVQLTARHADKYVLFFSPRVHYQPNWQLRWETTFVFRKCWEITVIMTLNSGCIEKVHRFCGLFCWKALCYLPSAGFAYATFCWLGGVFYDRPLVLN